MKRTKLTDGWKVYRDAVSAGRTSYLDGGVYHYYREMDFPESMRAGGRGLCARILPGSRTFCGK